MLGRYLENSIVIHQDTYIPPETEIPLIDDHIDWERPEAINWISFENAISEAKRSFKYVIVEGLFVYWNEKINQYYDKHLFISLSKPVFVKRKREDLRWGAEPDWYIEHIWQGHSRYGMLPSAIPDPIIINGEQDFDINGIIRHLKLAK
jgi:uridine kinase